MRLHEFPFADIRELVFTLEDLSRTLDEVVGEELNREDPSPLGDDTEFAEAYIAWKEGISKLPQITTMMRAQRRVLQKIE